MFQVFRALKTWPKKSTKSEATSKKSHHHQQQRQQQQQQQRFLDHDAVFPGFPWSHQLPAVCWFCIHSDIELARRLRICKCGMVKEPLKRNHAVPIEETKCFAQFWPRFEFTLGMFSMKWCHLENRPSAVYLLFPYPHWYASERRLVFVSLWCSSSCAASIVTVSMGCVHSVKNFRNSNVVTLWMAYVMTRSGGGGVGLDDGGSEIKDGRVKDD